MKTLYVERSWKGILKRKIELVDDKSDCHLFLQKGDKWLIFASGEPLEARQCSGSVRFEQAKDELEMLERIGGVRNEEVPSNTRMKAAGFSGRTP